MKKLITVGMLVLSIMAMFTPTTITAQNISNGIEVCSDLKPRPNPYDDIFHF